MSVFMQPIFTQTIGAGGAASVTFNNIPQGFTDLKFVISARSNQVLSSGGYAAIIRPNSVTTNGSGTQVFNDSTSIGSNRWLEAIYFNINPSDYTSNTFGLTEVYVPNYTSGNFKAIAIESVIENNAAASPSGTAAGLYRSTTPITSMTFVPFIGNFVQYSTFTLYGISNVYDTAAPIAPIIGTVTDEAGFASVAFTPASNDRADSYVVTSIPSGSTTYGAVSPITTPAVLDTSYTYQVAAVNSLGSSASASSSALTTVNNYTSIATGTISTTTSFFDFTNIPQNYKHLQLRCRVRGGSGASTTDYFLVQIMPFTSNSDYFTHALESVGDVVRGSVYQPTNTFSTNLMSSNGADANNFTSVIIDFYDYATTNIFKRAQMFSGWSMPNTTGGQNNGNITLSGGILPQFLPISNIRLAAYVNLTVGSTFSLYGVS